MSNFIPVNFGYIVKKVILLLKSRYMWNKLRKWHAKNYKDYPWRSQEIDAWGILLAEMLLRRTDSPTVAKIFPEIYRKYPTPKDMANASEQEILEHVRPLGLWGQRSRALLHLSRALVGRHRGKVPKNLDKLLALPHVGPYVAGAVMVFAFGRPAPMPDVNIIRIMSRYFCLPDKTPRDIKRLAEVALEQCPRGRARQFFYALLDLGSAHCRARARCPGCPLERKCQSRRGIRLDSVQIGDLNVAEDIVIYSNKVGNWKFV